MITHRVSHDHTLCHMSKSIPYRKEGPLPVDEVAKEYIKLAVDYDNYFPNTKYTLAQMVLTTDLNKGRALLATSSTREIW